MEGSYLMVTYFGQLCSNWLQNPIISSLLISLLRSEEVVVMSMTDIHQWYKSEMCLVDTNDRYSSMVQK